MTPLWKTLEAYLTYLMALILILFLSGCNFIKPFTDKDLGTFGPEPLIQSDSMQKIDLVLLLDPDAERNYETWEESWWNFSDKGLLQRQEALNKAFNNFYKEMDALGDSDGAKRIRKQRRNAIQERIIAASNQRCGEYKKLLKALDSRANFVLGSLTTAVAGAGAIFTPASTVRALSGIASIISGVRSEFNEDYFANQTIQVLTQGFEKQRSRLYEGIEKAQKKDLEDYLVEKAIGDAIKYHFSCTLNAGLEEAAVAIERADNPGIKQLEKMQKDLARINALPKITKAEDDLVAKAADLEAKEDAVKRARELFARTGDPGDEKAANEKALQVEKAKVDLARANALLKGLKQSGVTTKKEDSPETVSSEITKEDPKEISENVP